MRLSNKHSNVQTITYSDFSGGLNTSQAPEDIAENELSKAINVEIYKGKLQTVAGTKRIYFDAQGTFTDLIYDAIEDKFLLIDAERNAFHFHDGSLTKVGTLTGKSVIQYASWESGVLIASGGQLQYYHDDKLETIAVDFTQDNSSWTKVVPSEWAEGTTYNAGDVVTRNQTYYACKQKHAAVPSIANDMQYWQNYVINDWATNTGYKVGDIVKHDNVLYQCLTTHTTADKVVTTNKTTTTTDDSGTQKTDTNETTSTNVTITFDEDKANWKQITILAWTKSTVYKVNDMVNANNLYYQCMTAHTSDNGFQAEYWNQTVPETWQFDKSYTKYQSLIVQDGEYYICRDTHTSVTNAPNVCHGVFIKDGRVWIYYSDELHCSAVGDEWNWTNDSNDESSAQWLRIGYKDGGHIVGVCSLSSDILIFKDNGHAYHLSGSFPNWTVKEIGRQIHCSMYNSCISLASTSFVLGEATMQSINVTDEYGDMQASTVSDKVSYDINNLHGRAKLRYLPKLNQVWLIDGTNMFLFLDVNNGGWFYRQYATPVVDAIEANNTVYLLKANGLYILQDVTTVQDSTDENQPLNWYFQAKTLLSNNNFLIKRVRVMTTPYHYNYITSEFHIGDVVIGEAQPVSAYYIYHNYGHLYHSKKYIFGENPARLIVNKNADPVYENSEYLYHNENYLWTADLYRNELRCVNRKRVIRVYGRGNGGITVFNQLSFDIAEV